MAVVSHFSANGISNFLCNTHKVNFFVASAKQIKFSKSLYVRKPLILQLFKFHYLFENSFLQTL